MKDTTDRILWKLMVLVAMIIIAIILFNKSGCKSTLQELSKRDTVIEPAKVLINTKTDTLWMRDTVVFKSPQFPPQIEYIIFEADSAKMDSLKRLCEAQRMYVDTFIDTNIFLFVKIETIGVLKSTELKYLIRTPLSVVTTNDYAINPSFVISAGMETGVINNKMNLSARVALSKNKYSYSYRYDFLNKSHNIGVSTTLFTKYPK